MPGGRFQSSLIGVILQSKGVWRTGSGSGAMASFSPLKSVCERKTAQPCSSRNELLDGA
jgi:hypothetical protein